MDYFSTVLEELGDAAAKGYWAKIESYIDTNSLDDSYGYLSRLLLMCCHYGGTSTVKKLIQEGANVNYI